jgi:hypothetical protein
MKARRKSKISHKITNQTTKKLICVQTSSRGTEAPSGINFNHGRTNAKKFCSICCKSLSSCSKSGRISNSFSPTDDEDSSSVSSGIVRSLFDKESSNLESHVLQKKSFQFYCFIYQDRLLFLYFNSL